MVICLLLNEWVLMSIKVNIFVGSLKKAIVPFFVRLSARSKLLDQGIKWTILIGVLCHGNHAYADHASSTCYALEYEVSILDHFKGDILDTSAIDNLAGKTIRKIQFLRGGVFDINNEHEDNGLYRMLNDFHINTKEPVLASQLLFAEGDVLEPEVIHETERLLRRRSYLTEAFIVPACIRDDQVDLIIITRDGWSFDVEGALSFSGGDSTTGIGLKDGNIFGTGSSLSVGYEEDESRSGIYYNYSTPHVLNSRIATFLSYADKSDGRDYILEVEKPFFASTTPWAAGVAYRNVTEALTIHANDKVINEFNRKFVYEDVYYGFATHMTANYTQRILGGYSREVNEFVTLDTTQQAIPPDREESYPWLGYQFRQDHYAVYRNLNQIQRTEDVDLGTTFDARLGYGHVRTGGGGDVVRYIGRYQHILDIDDKHLLSVNLFLDGRDHINQDGDDSAILRSKIAYNMMQTPKNRWYASLAYDVGRDLQQYEELTIGGDEGLKGYPTDFQRGKKRVHATIERRYYSDWHWFNLIRVGAVAFLEAGKAWDGPANQRNPMLMNAGLGLRLSSSKVRVGNILHLDIATPLVEKSGIDSYQILVEVRQTF